MGGLSGLVADIAPDQLQPDGASYSENVKAVTDGWAKSDGYTSTSLTPGNEMTHLFFYSPTDGDDRWFVAGDTTIKYYRGALLTDATRDADPYNKAGSWRWSFTDFNGVLVANNSVDEPQSFNITTNKFQDITELDSKVRFRTLVKFKSYLFGLGVDSGQGYNDSEVYWSHPADPGFLPANWDFADPASDSGKNTLPSSGYLLDALELGNSLIIYKSDSTWICRFAGGQFVFSFEPKWDSQGLLARGCVTQFEGKHFVVTQTDIMVHNGVSSKSVADRRVKKFFFDNLSRENFQRTFVVKRPDTNEIYIFYPSRDSAEGYLDSALIYHWVNDNWEFRKLPELTSAAFGTAIPEGVKDWDSQTGPWEQEGTWQLGEDGRIFAPTLYMAMKDKNEIQVPSYSGLDNDQPIQGIWERRDIVLGPVSRDGVVGQNYENYKTISALTFDVTTTEPFRVWLGFRDRLTESIIWEDFGDFDPTLGRTLDLIETTAFLSIRLVTNASGFILRNLHIEFEIGGEVS
ncbi:putative partical protein [Vibrio phage vB_VspS_VS-ABTNL-3]|nr:putative partical protein [Vibrio phage vB_VspS_VS-ABTNL-3]